MTVNSSHRKGIILAGGTGSRLQPLTLGVSKHLLPVYDKPLIYYPLSVLMLSGITSILVITTPHDQEAFQRLLGDGSRWGISLSYAVQQNPEGIAQALLLAKGFLKGAPSALVLGDNVFFGHDLSYLVEQANNSTDGATIFGYQVNDPERYGIVELDTEHRVLSIEEKPAFARSKLAVTGLYFYDGNAPEMAASLKPSARGELEITDLNRLYLAQAKLKASVMGRGFAWFDAGTQDSLLEAGQFVATLQRRQNMVIASPEEIALSKGWIDDKAFTALSHTLKQSEYGRRLFHDTKPERTS